MASTLTKENMGLFASELLMDQSDLGGGRIIGTPIISGQENSMFSDISSLDRVNGRVV